MNKICRYIYYILQWLAIIAALCVLCGGVYHLTYSMPPEKTALFPEIITAVDSNGYTVSDDWMFISVSNDSQFYLTMPERYISSMRVSFAKPLAQDMNFQVFYSKADENWSENDSVSRVISSSASELIIDIPKRD